MPGSEVNQVVRLSVAEYGHAVELISTTVAGLGYTKDAIGHSLVNAGQRIARILRLADNPIAVDATGVRVSDIAGLVRVDPRIELEVVPKFLDITSRRWREDFFYLAMLSRHGRLLASERLAAASGARDDLATLIARAMVGMYQDCQRRPLRTYRRTTIVDFHLDGEVEAEDLWLPTAEGYSQDVVLFDRQNGYNAAILAAMRTLTPEIRQPETRRLMLRTIESLAPQRRSFRSLKKVVPSRSRRWQSLYDLSLDVLDGFGLRYGNATARAPGFVLDTWRIWEDTLTLALRLSMGSQNTLAQSGVVLGTRETFGPKTTRSSVVVTPDVSVLRNQAIDFLVDAKYKGRTTKARTRIVESDLYEALAFATAAGCREVVLAYPAVARSSVARELGSVRLFERIDVGEVVVAAVDIEVQGISERGGLWRFADTLHKGLERVVVTLRTGRRSQE